MVSLVSEGGVWFQEQRVHGASLVESLTIFLAPLTFELKGIGSTALPSLHVLSLPRPSWSHSSC